MNFLAHLHLGQHLPTIEAAGNLTADHCKQAGNDAFRRGVMVHRTIDAYTDAHPLTAKARALFPGSYRRFGGVLSDLVFDHCLARTWEEWSDHDSVDAFVSMQLTSMLAQSDQLPAEAVEAISRMDRGQWLQSYAEIEGMRITIERIVRRRPFAVRMLGAEAIMETHYEGFEHLFRKFYPLLQARVQEEL